MDIRKEIEDELKALAPNLAKIEKNNPFKIDEHYFETFSRKISDAIALRDSKKQSWNWDWLWKWLLKPQYAVSFAVVMVFIVFSVNYFSPQERQLTLDDLDTEEITKYVQEHISDFNYEIMEQYCCVDMNSSDYLFQDQQEREKFFEDYLINQINEEDFL